MPTDSIGSSNQDIFWVALLLLFLTLALGIAFAYGWWITRQKDSVSPYTGTPLRRAENFSFYVKEQILRYLYERQSFENRMFTLNKASFCRDTGRIFPDSVTWYDVIRVDWSFIQKRHPGNYVSWGSLTEQQKDAIRRTHGSLQGYNTTYSSSRSSPREIEPDYALARPGPLYVDIEKNVLLGWKNVPGTEFEVMIVQKPIKYIMPNERT